VAKKSDVLLGFDSGTISSGSSVALSSARLHRLKVRPLHDLLVERGIRVDTEIFVTGPRAAPVPIMKELSQNALEKRGIEYVPNQTVVELDTRSSEARLASGGSAPYDLFVGIPVHRR